MTTRSRASTGTSSFPTPATYRVYGVVRPDRGAPDELLDTLQGVGGNVVVTSSSRAFDGVSVRGSKAFDGDRATGWVPGRAITGEWLEARFSQPRSVSEVMIEQPEEARGWISEADITVDGRRVATARLSRERVVVPVPTTRGSVVRVRVTARQGEGLPFLSEVRVADARVTDSPVRASRRCVSLGTVDGAPLRARVIGGVDGDGPRTFQGCDPLVLGAGEHRLRSAAGWTMDSLVLRDAIGEFVRSGQPGPQVTVERRSSSSYRVIADAASAPYLLVVGQNHHRSWRATMDGVDLGPPVVVDGYALGWWVSDLDPHVFAVEYSAQSASDAAMVVSGAAAILSTALLLVPGRRTPSPAQPRGPPSSDRPWRRLLRPGRRRSWMAWSLFVVGCWVFAGTVGLVAGAVVTGWTVLAAPRSRTILHVATAAMALVPVAWILGNLAP